MMDLPEALIRGVKQRKVILFAGAGLSSHLGLPLFDVLKAHLAEQSGLQDWAGLEFPVLAEYYLSKTQKRDELWSWMKETWNPPAIDILASQPHRCIVDLDFPVIYTTNYDSWLEAAFAAAGKPFRKIVNVSDLADTVNGETEIIKFHGDLEHPGTIVLTESSFLRRMSLDEPLDIRLRSDSLAKPILFAGYSMSDPNIRYLLFKLGQLWEMHSDRSKKPTSFLLMAEENEAQHWLLSERGVEGIVAPGKDVNAGLTCFFQTLSSAVRLTGSAV
jgi:SIR2-like protein